MVNLVERFCTRASLRPSAARAPVLAPTDQSERRVSMELPPEIPIPHPPVWGGLVLVKEKRPLPVTTSPALFLSGRKGKSLLSATGVKGWRKPFSHKRKLSPCVNANLAMHNSPSQNKPARVIKYRGAVRSVSIITIPYLFVKKLSFLCIVSPSVSHKALNSARIGGIGQQPVLNRRQNVFGRGSPGPGA